MTDECISPLRQSVWFESAVARQGFSKSFGSASLSRLIREEDDAEALFARFA
jgi:hypothetical protein